MEKEISREEAIELARTAMRQAMESGIDNETRASLLKEVNGLRALHAFGVKEMFPIAEEGHEAANMLSQMIDDAEWQARQRNTERFHAHARRVARFKQETGIDPHSRGGGN